MSLIDEDGYLQFVALGTSASHVPKVNDGTSGAIRISEGLPIGNSTQNIAYVSNCINYLMCLVTILLITTNQR